MGQLEPDAIISNLTGRGNIMMMRVGQNLPVETAKTVITQAIAGGKMNDMDAASVSILGHRLVQEGDPAGGMDWLAGLPENLTKFGTRSAMAEWMEADPMSATAYAGRMPAGTAKDSALHSVVASCIMHKDYDLATQWANAVSDPAARASLSDLIAKKR